MLLAIDIGNTNIVLGLYQGKKLVTHWRLATQAERTADEYGVIISQLIDYSGHRSQQISAIAVSSSSAPMAGFCVMTLNTGADRSGNTSRRRSCIQNAPMVVPAATSSAVRRGA